MGRSEKKETSKLMERYSHIKTLVRKAIAGDARAKEKLLELFQPFLARLITAAIRNFPEGEREALEAEVRFLFLSLLSEFDERRGVPFSAYVQQKLPQRLRNFLRATQQMLAREVPLGDRADEAGTVLCKLLTSNAGWELFDEVILRIWLQQAVETLSQRERQVFTSILEGYSEREIAAHLMVSGSRVHILKEKARVKLREYWGEYG